MALDERIAEERLSPKARRAHLRAFADRMLLRAVAMDDPEDMDGLERAVRAAAVIERIYSRCDRAEGQAPDPRKLEAERARHADEAIKARVSLAGTLKWAEARRADLGPWWEAAQAEVTAQASAQTTLRTPAKVSPKAAPVKDHQTVSQTADKTVETKAAGLPGLSPVKHSADEALKTLAVMCLRNTASAEFGTTEGRHPTTPP